MKTFAIYETGADPRPIEEFLGVPDEDGAAEALAAFKGGDPGKTYAAVEFTTGSILEPGAGLTWFVQAGAVVAIQDPAELLLGDYLIQQQALYEPPLDLDYKTGLVTRLEREPIFDPVHKGFVVEIALYAPADVSLDPVTGAPIYSGTPLIREFYDWFRDPLGMPVARNMTPRYVRRDGTLHPEFKVHPRTFSLEERMRKSREARRNVIDHLEVVIGGLLVETRAASEGGIQPALNLGRAFLADYSSEISVYVTGANDDLRTVTLADATHAWLDDVPASIQIGGQPDITIRDVIVSEITLPSWSAP